MGFNIPSIEELIRSANEDLAGIQNEISYIKSTDADKLFSPTGRYKDAFNFLGSPSKSDLDMMKDILLSEKLKREYQLKDVLSNQTESLRNQKIDDILG